MEWSWLWSLIGLQSTVRLNGIVGLRWPWIRQPDFFYVVADFSKSCYCSVTGSCLTFVTPWTVAHQAYLSSTISWSLLKFKLVMLSNHLILCLYSFCLQSFPGSRSFPISWLFASGSQCTGALALATVLPVDIQGWFPLELTDLIPLLFKGLSRVFSNTTVQKHHLFGTQSSLCSNCNMCTWLLEKLYLDYLDLCWQSDISAF